MNVIVVGATPDTKQYLDVMERGAFDFVVAPFEREPLGFVVRSAGLRLGTSGRAELRTAMA